MKPLWWSRLTIGNQIKLGETIWDEVEDYVEKYLNIQDADQKQSVLEDFVERFNNVRSGGKGGAGGDKNKKDG